MFGVNPQARNRLRTKCRPCRAEVESERRAADPVLARRKRLALTLSQYGMTPDDYDRMLKDQSGVCAICSQAVPGHGHARLVVDHDHKTNKARGLLCSPCNVGIANFRDDPTRLQSAARYLAPR